MDAIVMAAGEGRRMRPLTRRWAKPLLPIDGRPVIATLLRELAGAGFESVTIVVGHLAAQVEALVGDGSAFAVGVRYVDQPEAVGSADAVRRALGAGARPPLLVSAADTVYEPGDVRRVRDLWATSGAAGGIGVRDVDPSEVDGKTPVTVAANRLVALGAPPKTSGQRTLAAAPLWFLDAELAASVENVPGPPYELATTARNALAEGTTILALPLGPTRDLTRPEDVILRNFPYLSR